MTTPKTPEEGCLFGRITRARITGGLAVAGLALTALGCFFIWYLSEAKAIASDRFSAATRQMQQYADANRTAGETNRQDIGDLRDIVARTREDSAGMAADVRAMKATMGRIENLLVQFREDRSGGNL